MKQRSEDFSFRDKEFTEPRLSLLESILIRACEKILTCILLQIFRLFSFLKSNKFRLMKKIFNLRKTIVNKN